MGKYSFDESFLRQHTELIVLQHEKAAVAVAPAYQGRVMTSTFDRLSGPSFGWINHPVVEKGILPTTETKGTLEEHIYIFGGEERLWLGPEGGQFGLFFPPGSRFEFSDWKTPAAIDAEPFKTSAQTLDGVAFKHTSEFINWSGTTFHIGIERMVQILKQDSVEELLGEPVSADIRFVGYESINRIKNVGNNAWTAETGLPSIWLLGMYNPSPETIVVIPFKSGQEEALGPKVNDTYFGKVPPEYLRIDEDVLFFMGDGTWRSKIGISPLRSRGIVGSFDAQGSVLNLVLYNVQAAPNGFVNSMWEIQDRPYDGDVINSYNDGAPEPGADPLGPFYELETSSPAAALRPGEQMTHIQQTWHFHGPAERLDRIAIKTLGVTLEEITGAFQE